MIQISEMLMGSCASNGETASITEKPTTTLF